MTRERLIKVTSPSQLHVGAIVVMRPCPRCHEAHRYMLIRSGVHGPCESCGKQTQDWVRIPQTYHQSRQTHWCPCRAIADDRLFLVDVGDTRELSDEELAPKRTRRPEAIR
jgi:hypothetical protein